MLEELHAVKRDKDNTDFCYVAYGYNENEPRYTVLDSRTVETPTFEEEYKSRCRFPDKEIMLMRLREKDFAKLDEKTMVIAEEAAANNFDIYVYADCR